MGKLTGSLNSDGQHALHSIPFLALSGPALRRDCLEDLEAVNANWQGRILSTPTGGEAGRSLGEWRGLTCWLGRGWPWRGVSGRHTSEAPLPADTRVAEAAATASAACWPALTQPGRPASCLDACTGRTSSSHTG